MSDQDRTIPERPRLLNARLRSVTFGPTCGAKIGEPCKDWWPNNHHWRRHGALIELEDDDEQQGRLRGMTW